jgi:hypothetical protein
MLMSNEQSCGHMMLNGNTLNTSWATPSHWAYNDTGTGSLIDSSISLNTRLCRGIK